MRKRILAFIFAVTLIVTSVSYVTAAEIDPSSSGRSTTTYVLEDNIVWGAWDNDYEHYNCYAYALGLTDAFHWPGKFSTNPTWEDSDLNNSIYTLASYVQSDLMSATFSNQCVTMTTTAPSSLLPGQSCICIRKGPDDFHFMKFSSGAWYHKPGRTNPLKYMHTPSASKVWKGEFSYKGVAYEGSTVYDSAIYFLIYSQNHGSTTSTYSGRNYHAGSRHFFEYEHRCDSCGVVVSTSLTNKACSGPPCSILQGGTPNPEVA